MRTYLKVLLFVFLVSFILSSSYVGYKVYQKSVNKIGIITIEGTIATSDAPSNSVKIANILEKARTDDGIKAIIVRVDSPGGTPAAIQDIIREIDKTKKKKPVVISMGDIATSGAYIVSCAADWIFAEPGTLTGGLGAIIVLEDRSEQYEKEGVKFYVIKSTDYKDLGADYRSPKNEELELLTELVNSINDQMIITIAENRNMDIEKVRKIADGTIFTGETAKNLGLVDDLGNMNDAIEYAKGITGIQKEHIIYLK